MCLSPKQWHAPPLVPHVLGLTFQLHLRLVAQQRRPPASSADEKPPSPSKQESRKVEAIPNVDLRQGGKRWPRVTTALSDKFFVQRLVSQLGCVQSTLSCTVDRLLVAMQLAKGSL